MKTIIIGIAVSVISLSACNGSGNEVKTNTTAKDSMNMQAASGNTQMVDSNTQTKKSASISEIVSGYLQVKNALAKDNGTDAADGGKAMVAAIQKFDESSLTDSQKKDYDDMKSAMQENAEHIGLNADKIAHQREHFDMLSQDMYDMVKEYGGGQTLYKDYCPMYNNKKGAYWISETKEIKNPYLGKAMPTCGEVKEELK